MTKSGREFGSFDYPNVMKTYVNTRNNTDELEMLQAEKISGCQRLWVRGEFDYKGVTWEMELLSHLDFGGA